MRRRTRYVLLAGGAGAEIGSTLPHAILAEGVPALLAAAASGALIAGLLVSVLASVNG